MNNWIVPALVSVACVGVGFGAGWAAHPKTAASPGTEAPAAGPSANTAPKSSTPAPAAKSDVPAQPGAAADLPDPEYEYATVHKDQFDEHKNFAHYEEVRATYQTWELVKTEGDVMHFRRSFANKRAIERDTAAKAKKEAGERAAQLAEIEKARPQAEAECAALQDTLNKGQTQWEYRVVALNYATNTGLATLGAEGFKELTYEELQACGAAAVGGMSGIRVLRRPRKAG